MSTTSFFVALSCTFLMRCANKSVLVVSVTAFVSGLIVQMTEMRAFPASDGCSIRVSFEFRNGTWSCLLRAAFSASVPMTDPSVSRLCGVSCQGGGGDGATHLVLMNLPSRVRSLSEVAFSDPARSMRDCQSVTGRPAIH